MSIFLLLPAQWRPKGKSSLSDLPDVWCVDMFLRIGSGSPGLVAARVAKGGTFKTQRIGSVSGYGAKTKLSYIWYSIEVGLLTLFDKPSLDLQALLTYSLIS